MTLLELMIVVGIIAIAAMVVGPNYSKMQARSRQAEAKASLSTVHSLMKACFVSVGTYTQCFKQIGFDVNQIKYYGLGIRSSGSLCGPRPSLLVSCRTYQYNSDGSAMASCGVPDDYHLPVLKHNSAATINSFTLVGGGTLTTRTTFEAKAVGSISGKMMGFVPVLDTWLINQDKVLTNTWSGI